MKNHIPVLLNEVVDYLITNKSGIYFDCTFGCGGHAKSLLNNLDENAKLYGIDVDDEAIMLGNELEKQDPRFKIIKSNFVYLKKVIWDFKIEKVDGFLFDFGVSSPQLDQANRGFSYHLDGPLDMRMDQSSKLTAEYIVNNFSVQQLTRIFQVYGESKYAFNVAKKICYDRKKNSFSSTLQLIDSIKAGLPKKVLFEKKHPARVFFQALRIEVNNELEVIKLVLNQLDDLLKPEGRAVFITFHSLEEKIIKNWIRDNCNDIDLLGLTKKIPNKFSLVLKKYLKPEIPEIELNPRSRSAKLWIIKKN